MRLESIVPGDSNPSPTMDAPETSALPGRVEVDDDASGDSADDVEVPLSLCKLFRDADALLQDVLSSPVLEGDAAGGPRVSSDDAICEDYIEPAAPVPSSFAESRRRAEKERSESGAAGTGRPEGRGVAHERAEAEQRRNDEGDRLLQGAGEKERPASGAAKHAIIRLESIVLGGYAILGYRKNDSTFKEVVKTRHRSSIPFVEDERAGSVDYRHLLNHLWRCFLAAAGLLDILAWVLPDYVRSSLANNEGNDEEVDPKVDPSATDNASFPRWFLEFVQWLDGRSNEIFFFFSFLWLVNVIVSARKRQRKAYIEEERRRLLGTDEGAKPKQKQWAVVAHHVSVALQFLSLPVGFYLGLGSVPDAILRRSSLAAARAAAARIDLLKKSVTSKAAKRLLEMAARNPFRFYSDLRGWLTALRWIKYLAPLVAAGNKLLGETLGVLKKQDLLAQARRMQKATRLLWGEKEKKKLTRGMAAASIQRSFRAHYLRRAQSSMLLMGNGKEQRLLLMIQRRFRQRLVEARERTAAKKRELKRLQMMRRMNSKIMSDDDKRKMYQLQDELGKEAKELLDRKLLLRPNTKFAVLWKAFFIAAVLCEMAQKAAKPMLHDKTRNVKLTMGEFVAKTLVPTRLSDLPECQATEKNDAGESIPEHFPWYCREPVVKWQGGLRDVAALALVPAPVSQWPECQQKETKAIDRVLRLLNTILPIRLMDKRQNSIQRRRSPEQRRLWYCQDSYPDRHATYRKLVDFTLQHVQYLLGAVMFLDVFVTFFTGRFHASTGELVPTPWFPRWVLPGLALQLVVNPNVADVAGAVRRCLGVAFDRGPYRTYQHVVAAGFPLAYGAARALVEWAWLPLVASANGRGAVASPFLRGRPSARGGRP